MRQSECVFIGLDIGGTKFMAAAADAQGTIGARTREATPPGLDEGLARLHRMIETVAGGRRVAAIGAAIGGPLDWRTGVVSPLHQPAWRDVPLRAIMAERWRCPFHVDVDTNVAALGEYKAWGRPIPRFLYITVSTGMGGGFLVDGRIYRGRDGAHPEAAHQAIPFRCSRPAAVACECGAPDCVEALVSGNAIRRIYGKPAEELSADEWAEVSHNFGQALRNLAALYAPDVIAVGGGVAFGAGEKLLGPARSLVRDRLKIVPPPEICLSRLEYDTALAGAVTVAIQGLGE